MPLIACLLTRNEEGSIARAVHSVRAVADRVIVADTGSTDRTAEVASGAGAEVVPVAWDDDFAAGRNTALDRVGEGWVLWLNADEELMPESAPLVRPCVDDAGADVFGFTVLIRERWQEDRPDLWVETADLRLFRNRPDVRYVGRLHPTLRPGTAGAEGTKRPAVQTTPIVVVRHAYQSTLDASKLRWAARLLERELSDRPGQLGFLIEYGFTLARLGDPRAGEVLAEATEAVAAEREAPAAPNASVQVLLEALLQMPPEQLRGPLSREDATALALRWFPNSPPILWALAEQAFREREIGRREAAGTTRPARSEPRLRPFAAVRPDHRRPPCDRQPRQVLRCAR